MAERHSDPGSVGDTWSSDPIGLSPEGNSAKPTGLASQRSQPRTLETLTPLSLPIGQEDTNLPDKHLDPLVPRPPSYSSSRQSSQLSTGSDSSSQQHQMSEFNEYLKNEKKDVNEERKENQCQLVKSLHSQIDDQKAVNKDLKEELQQTRKEKDSEIVELKKRIKELESELKQERKEKHELERKYVDELNSIDNRRNGSGISYFKGK